MTDGNVVPSVTADYVIVGAGSAGCVLAHRLSADPAVQVWLLEPGSSGMALKSVDRARSTAWCISGALAQISTDGLRRAARDGHSTTCCRIS